MIAEDKSKSHLFLGVPGEDLMFRALASLPASQGALNRQAGWR
jgi:hypothetical protein